MWTRKELKNRAKAAIHRNYWRTILVSIIFMFATGGGANVLTRMITGAGVTAAISYQDLTDSDDDWGDIYKDLSYSADSAAGITAMSSSGSFSLTPDEDSLSDEQIDQLIEDYGREQGDLGAPYRYRHRTALDLALIFTFLAIWVAIVLV